MPFNAEGRRFPSPFVFLALLAAAASIAALLRFSNIGNRLLWQDETVTVLHASGYTESEFARTFVDGKQHEVREMRRYQGAGTQGSAQAVLRALALEDPQHPPFYYVMLFVWERAVGTSLLSARILSALIGLSLIPAMYWLCVELFESRRSAIVGAALMAVSPFFFAYSHQLREYGLLALITLVSGALALRLQREPTVLRGWLYGISLAAGLYVSPFFIAPMIGESGYLLLSGTKAAQRAALAAACGALASYVPWLGAMALQSGVIAATNDWSSGRWPAGMLMEKWAFNTGAAFFDMEYLHAWLVAVLIPILAAIAYAVVFVVRESERRTQTFIACILLSTAVLFLVTDAVLGAHRSAITRYGTVFYLGLLLSMAALLGRKIAASQGAAYWRAAALALVFAGLSCCIVQSRMPVWWDNHEDDEVIPIASQIDSANHPLVVSLSSWRLIYMLSFRLNDDVRIVFPDLHAGLHVRIRAPGRDTFVVARRIDEMKYVTARDATLLEPLYISRYSSLWQAFHRQLRSERPAPDASDTMKLSLWRMLPAARLSGAAM